MKMSPRNLSGAKADISYYYGNGGCGNSVQGRGHVDSKSLKEKGRTTGHAFPDHVRLDRCVLLCASQVLVLALTLRRARQYTNADWASGDGGR